MRPDAVGSCVNTRRRFLGAWVAGTAGILAGCAGIVSEGPGETSTPAGNDPTTSGGDLRFEEEWTGVEIEKGDGWVVELPDVQEPIDLFYSVTASDDVRFDVYAFHEERTKRTYERWVEASGDEREETMGITGVSGATSRNQLTSVEREAFVDPGTMWVAVDHSNFDGGSPRAKVNDESPERITVDVTIRATAAF